MNEPLLKAVSQLGCPKIMIVGDHMLDVYIYGDALRISPEAPVPILKMTNTTQCCGGASSVVADIAALKAQPICLGLVGNDANGQTLIGLLNAIGADTSGILKSADRPTITKTRFIGLAQHRHQQQLFRMDEESTHTLSSDLTNKVQDLFEEKLNTVDVVCLQDYDKGFLNPALCQAMIHLAQQAGKSILVDPAYITDYSKYRGATLITPNRQEASKVVGFDLIEPADFRRAAEQLTSQFDLDACIITLDKEGAYLKTPNKSQLIPTRPRRVYDVTGAGDMVLAMLATSIASGHNYATAARLSNIAGGIEVEKYGVATVTREEIIQDILTQRRGTTGKVCDLTSLLAQLKWYRSQQKKIVFTNGCFDILHRGHVEYLQFCKAQGDVVVVGLNSDASVRTIKGPTRPINNQKDRAAVIVALESVGFVTVFDEADPMNLIRAIRPDVLVKGQDWQDKGVVGADFVKAQGGKVALAPLVKGKSSTAVIEKLKSIHIPQEAREYDE